MFLNGVYTIKNGKNVIKSKNSIQNDGFQLLRNWFVYSDANDLQLVNLDNSTITSNNIGNGTVSNVVDVFSNYDGNYSTVTANTTDYVYYNVVFGQVKKIRAIGIDVLQTSSKNTNANIQIAYLNKFTDQNGNQIYQTEKKVQDFLIPVPYYVASNLDKTIKGANQQIYRFKQPIQTKGIKLFFNNFSDSKINYRIYAIRFYVDRTIYVSPTRISLWGGETKGDNNHIVDRTQPIKTKPIQLKLSDSSRNSIIYKANLQFGDLDSTDSVYAISTQFLNKENQLKQFSFSKFTTPWQQQTMQVIQIQYQLFFSNSDDELQSYSSESDNQTIS